MKSVSCIVPIYGLDKGYNKMRFEQLVLSLSKARDMAENITIELIIVNDDLEHISRMEIMNICCLYKLDNILKYVENKTNLGQSKSRNVGLYLAENEYVHFMDQDDFVSENFYHFFSDNIKPNVDMYICKPFFYLERQNISIPAYTRLLDKCYRKYVCLKDLWFLLISNIAYSPGQVIVKKDLIISNGGFPYLENLGSDDYALFYNLVFDSNVSYLYLNQSFFFYRIHIDQNSKKCNMKKSVIEFFDIATCPTLKQKIVCSLKTMSFLSVFNRLFYILFFKRAVS